ncbi:hypothetical protein [Rhodospirillum sp. A1_3_36]|uniref:hypothetical protein n=1 Tax=Rhodospirillum sp. A1_3_36 TaxID=3391666 RepID=UPI0039A623F6
MSNRPKAKLIIPIWGQRYVEEFAQISLPSYLAPGNLPALLEMIDLEILVMTTEETVDIFKQEAAFQALQRFCQINFLMIDDLVTNGLYGVTLTLAYARGVMSVGTEQVNTWFLFMNSDFVLADGSLRTLAEKMIRGDAHSILAPSLRAESEVLAPLLAKTAEQNAGILTVPPRDLVRMTFENLHATVIAKTVTQGLMTCQTHNQIYWQVDGNTLLARHYLIFMMAIKPERPLPPINSYCDYGFIPELVPSGSMDILDDSDDFFMLELQNSRQELEYILTGMSNPKRIAAHLSSWTSAEHRAVATRDIVFHTEDLPPRLDSARQGLATFIAKVSDKLSPKPVDHVDHFYWTSGLQYWQLSRELAADDKNAVVPWPSEVKKPLAIPKGLRKKFKSSHAGTTVSNFFYPIFQFLYIKVAVFIKRQRGRFPNIPVWHPLWLDAQLVFGAFEEIEKRAHQGILVVCSEDASVRSAVEERFATEALDLEAFVTGEVAPDGPVNTAFVTLTRQNILRLGTVLASIGRLLNPDGEIYVYIEHPNAQNDPGRFESEIVYYLKMMLPVSWLRYEIEARYVGGLIKRILTKNESACRRYLRFPSLHRFASFTLASCAWSVVVLLMAALNRLSRRYSKHPPPYCSSILVKLRLRDIDTSARTD